ncbi:CRISPR system Cascade subunit CasB [Actinokineospora baliensis]|uniref:type I-E CRISPR-associated protein Cse2/CasB n=1 Tax=Actinokineospora baliensis TaxID=547056 RepID=UPI00195C9CD1|nr:type I-E CRISPR-associated protein Cse2/CasB [Actinokineospora baliensis]MBM7774098.1 CRISPR system Cascade subunit CasB [Actinokineospora baliensis]
MPEKPLREFASDVVATLVEDYLPNPAIRTALRSGLSRPPEHRQCDPMHRYLARFCRNDTSGHRERCVYTVASLMAHFPEGARPDSPPRNLGASLAKASEDKHIAASTTEKLVHLVGRQTAETVCRRVVHVVVPLRQARVPVDFTALLRDLIVWPGQQSVVRKRWLQSYYLSLPGGGDR